MINGESWNSIQQRIYRQQQGTDIQPLTRPIPPAKPYPVEALGDLLSQLAIQLQIEIKAPMAIIANSLLACTSLAVQGYANVLLHGQPVPLSIYLLTIAESGERKSAVDNRTKKPINDWQREEMEKYRQEMVRHIAEQKLHDKKEKEALKNNQLCTDELPVKPKNPIITCEEPTFEGLYKHLEESVPSIGIFTDEGGMILGGYAMNSDNQTKTIAALSKLWDGKQIDRIRAGDGSSILYDRRCAIHIMVQPLIADKFYNDPTCKDQGILSRFLTVYPQSTKGERFYNTQMPRHSLVMINYESTIKRLLNRWRWDKRTGELELKTIKMNTEAKALWIQFHDEVEKEQVETGRYRRITGLASKAAEQVARVAGILQMFDNPDTVVITPPYVQNAITLVQYYLEEALRLNDSAIVPADIRQAIKLLEWFKQKQLQEIYPAKVYQEGSGTLRTKESATKILKLLEDHGYLMPYENPVLIDGKSRKKAWRIVAYSVDEVILPMNQAA